MTDVKMEGKKRAYLRRAADASVSEIPDRSKRRYANSVSEDKGGSSSMRGGCAAKYAAANPELPCTSHNLKKGEIDYGDLRSDHDLPGECTADDCESVVNECIYNAYESAAGFDEEQMDNDSDGGLSQDHLANSSDCCSIASDTESSIDETDGYVWETEFASNEFYSLHEDAGRKRTTTLDDRFFEPLYNGAEVTIFDYHISLFHFSLKHCLTKQGYKDLLKLVSQQLPSPNCALTSLYKLKKFFDHIFNEPAIEKHRYCSSCHHLLTKDEDATGTCPNKCSAVLEEFIICDIEYQLKAILSGLWVLVLSMAEVAT